MEKMGDSKEENVIDPDYYYDMKEAPPSKRLKTEHDTEQQFAIEKIEGIINQEFSTEISYKQSELDEIIERISIIQTMLDKLRGCAVTKFYSDKKDSSESLNTSASVHPAIKKIYYGKKPCETQSQISELSEEKESGEQTTKLNDLVENDAQISQNEIKIRSRRLKHKYQIIVGNVSRYIPTAKRENNDLSTHKWMIYVRTAKDQPSIDTIVNKVYFFLHPSYKPNDIVEVSHHPFYLTRRGWGEFPIRVQLHFHESRNKSVDIIHNLKLDKTFTGLQTLGAETVFDLLLFKENNETETPSTKRIESSQSLDDSANSNITIKEEPESICASQDNNPIIENLKEFKMEKDTPSSSKSSLSHISSQDIKPISPINSFIKVEKPESFSKTSSNGLRKFIKRKDKAGNIFLIPIENLSALCNKSTQGSSTEKSILINTSKPANVINLSNLNHININHNAAGNSSVSKMIKEKNELVGSDNDISILKIDTIGNLTNGFSASHVANTTHSFLKKSMDRKSSLTSVLSLNIKDKYIQQGNLKTVLKKVPFESQNFISTPKEFLNVPKSIQESSKTVRKMCNILDLVHFLAKNLPIIAKKEEKQIHHYSHECCETFLQLPTEKQKACEWQRARTIMKSWKYVINKKWNSHFNIKDIWTTKEIMIWCRKFAYTPAIQKINNSSSPILDSADIHMFANFSLSNASKLLKNLEMEKCEDSHKPESSLEIDVESIDEANELELPCGKLKRSPVKSDSEIILPSSPTSSYISQVSREVGVEIAPVQVISGVRANVIEDMLHKVCKCFMQDMLREAHAVCSENDKSGRSSRDISLSDVTLGILNKDTFDFLSMANMGEYIHSDKSSQFSS